MPIARDFSTKSKISSNLNPNWITGFCDAEVCFTVIISKRSNTLNWRVSVSFEINLHIKDIEILHKIQKYFGVGSVTSRLNRNLCVYRVTKIEDLLNVIIPQFKKYPLLTFKNSDYTLWSKVVDLMSTKEHLTASGFSTILTYYASINKGMSPTVLAAIPEITDVRKDIVVLPKNLNPNWISGFCRRRWWVFYWYSTCDWSNFFRFHVTQHSRDSSLMNLFVNFFGCGKVNIRSNTDRCDYYVQDFLQIYDNILPHFDNYPLYNIKSLDLVDFKKAADLYKEKGRNSTEDIKGIISNLNFKRDH